jgi:hypothetical protein
LSISEEPDPQFRPLKIGKTASTVSSPLKDDVGSAERGPLSANAVEITGWSIDGYRLAHPGQSRAIRKSQR